MAPDKKYITLFNFLGHVYDLPYTEGRYQRVLIQENSIDVHQGKLSDDTGTIQKERLLRKASFDSILQESSIVIIHDSMFDRESLLVETTEFFEHGGLEALVEYFQKGGKIIVHCVEGIYAIVLGSGSNISRQLLGSDNNISTTTMALTRDKAHLMRAPRVEALVTKKIYSREEFRNNYGSDSDDDEDAAYERYKQSEEGQHAVCVYEGFGSEGALIWNGDRGQNSVMKAVFEKLLEF
ncbi:MAG: hypothetical protein SGARI_005585 [Bacillariaceae sp.]